MKELEKTVRLCMAQLRSIGIQCGTVRCWKINTRAKNRWGQCKCAAPGIYEISIAACLLEDAAPEQALRDTVVHELLHTVPGCMNHGKAWKQLAAQVNRSLPGYRIRRLTPREEKGAAQIPASPYLLECTGCGLQIPRQRMCKAVQEPGRYRCGKCGSPLVRKR